MARPITRSSCRRHLTLLLDFEQLSRAPASLALALAYGATGTGHATVQQCRSLLLRILQDALDEGAIASNPVRKVPAPKRRADPDTVLAQAKRRALTPEDAGQLLARFPCSGGTTYSPCSAPACALGN
jgi:hypothetical protein